MNATVSVSRFTCLTCTQYATLSLWTEVHDLPNIQFQCGIYRQSSSVYWLPSWFCLVTRAVCDELSVWYFPFPSR